MPPHRLATLDLVIVVAYLVGTILLGVWFARRQQNVTTYFVGGRDMSWWLILFSIVGTETSTVTFLSVPGVAFNPQGGNLAFLQLAFGYVVGRVLIAWLLLPQYFQGELLTAYQLLRQRFSPAVQRAASGLFLITRTIADGLRLYLTAILLQLFTGWDGGVSLVVMGVAMIIFTYLGGMQAVVWTDLVQFLIYILGAVVAAGFIWMHLPGGVQEYLTVGEAAGKFRLIDLSPDPSKTYTLWTGLIGGACLTMATHGVDQLMVQRYLCTRSLTQARIALVLSGVVVVLQFLLFLLIGVGLYVLLGTKGTSLDNDRVFGWFIIEYLPPGVVGLVVAAVLAAAMSSSLNVSANAFVTDFYRPLRPERTEKEYLFVSGIMTLVWGLAQMGVGFVALGLGSPKSVVDQVLTVAGFTTGMVLGLFLLGRMKRPVRSGAALTGLACGLATVTAVWAGSTLAWPWYAPIGTVTTVAVAWLVGRRRPPEPLPGKEVSGPG